MWAWKNKYDTITSCEFLCYILAKCPLNVFLMCRLGFSHRLLICITLMWMSTCISLHYPRQADLLVYYNFCWYFTKTFIKLFTWAINLESHAIFTLYPQIMWPSVNATTKLFTFRWILRQEYTIMGVLVAVHIICSLCLPNNCRNRCNGWGYQVWVTRPPICYMQMCHIPYLSLAEFYILLHECIKNSIQLNTAKLPIYMQQYMQYLAYTSEQD